MRRQMIPRLYLQTSRQGHNDQRRTDTVSCYCLVSFLCYMRAFLNSVAADRQKYGSCQRQKHKSCLSKLESSDSCPAALRIFCASSNAYWFPDGRACAPWHQPIWSIRRPAVLLMFTVAAGYTIALWNFRPSCANDKGKNREY